MDVVVLNVVECGLVVVMVVSFVVLIIGVVLNRAGVELLVVNFVVD